MSGEVIITRNVEDELHDSYLRYSMSVIIARALPDVRDGLKPSQRRILFAMKNLNLSPSGKYRKCAKVAGDTSGDFHPHGETVIYPTLARMAQPWVMRYCLVNGQGNFGSVDGDPPAAMRYTEVRLTQYSVNMMEDLDKNTVDFVPNYDGSAREPVVFPAKFPNLLCNGSSGIAVGMATSIPSHNLHEVVQATKLIMDNPHASVDEILQVLPGPDFATKGIICGTDGIREAFANGKGRVIIRGVYEVEESSSGKDKIIIEELPYNVNKAMLVARIASLVNEQVITGIADIGDESNKNGIRIVIELKKGTIVDAIINQLYKHTDFQVSFNYNMVALENGMPVLMGIKNMISAWIQHREEVIRRRTQFQLSKAEARAHILSGYLVVLEHLDEIIAIVKSSQDRKLAKELLIEKYNFSSIQADSIMEMKLYQLTALEREKLTNEYSSLMDTISDLQAILKSQERIDQLIKDEMDEVCSIDKGKRLTVIGAGINNAWNVEDFIPNEKAIITFSGDDYVKRMCIDTFREQKRGGHGVGVDFSKGNDCVRDVYIASTHDHLLIFTNFGRCYWLKVWQIPECGRKSKGKSIVNFLEGLSKGETITATLSIADFNIDGYILFATKHGIVKKTRVDKYSGIRRSGIYAIKIDEGDEVIDVKFSCKGAQIMLFTKSGMAVRFKEDIVRATGRIARGVKGVTLRDQDDCVISCEVIDRENLKVLMVCQAGYGKKSTVASFRMTNRGAKGVRAIVTSKRNGPLVGGLVVHDGDGLVMMSDSGQTIRMSADDVKVMGRSTQGVRLVKIPSAHRIVGIQRIPQLITIQ